MGLQVLGWLGVTGAQPRREPSRPLVKPQRNGWVASSAQVGA